MIAKKHPYSCKSRSKRQKFLDEKRKGVQMSKMEIEHIEERLKRATCNHSAYKMLPIWGGLFGFCWECTQCGLIQQKLEERK